MAGITLGASSPASSPAPGAIERRTLYRVPATTRTRQLRGVCLAGDLLLSVYSTRREDEGRAVSLTLADGAAERTGSMSAPQARALADALHCAADAAERAMKGGAE